MKTLAFDYDGTISNTNQIKSEWIARHLDREVPSWKCDRTQCVPIIGLENYERMSGYVYGERASRLAEPMPGAIEVLRELAQRYALHIITARTPEGIQWTREWLGKHGIAGAFRDIHSSKGASKVEIAHRLGAVALVDDDARHLRGKEPPRFARLLFAPGGCAGVEPDIVCVRDWREIRAAIQGMP